MADIITGEKGIEEESGIIIEGKTCENCGGMGVKQSFKKFPDPDEIIEHLPGIANFTEKCRACKGRGKIAG